MDDCVDLSFSYSDFSECNIQKKIQNLTFCFLYLSVLLLYITIDIVIVFIIVISFIVYFIF